MRPVPDYGCSDSVAAENETQAFSNLEGDSSTLSGDLETMVGYLDSLVTTINAWNAEPGSVLTTADLQASSDAAAGEKKAAAYESSIAS